MKIKLHYILILFCLASPAFVSSLFAQDAGMQDLEIVESDKERMLYSPGGEGEMVYRSTPATVSVPPRDSVASVIPSSSISKTRPSAKSAEKQPSPPAKEDDDSILSFNFLYYIIQKYKLQDIVD